MFTTKDMGVNRPKILDLFCGCGGFSLGAARAGFEVAGAVDNDSIALKAHNINFPKTPHLLADLAVTTGEDLLELMRLNPGGLDGIIGGPPCQGFSNIGHRNKKDPRNQLFVRFFQLVQDLKPKFFLSENVPGLLSKTNSNLLRRALSKVRDDYTLLKPMKLSANDYGAPTTRTRVFFFGFRKDWSVMIDETSFEPPDDIQYVTVGDALKGIPAVKPSWQEEAQGWRKVRSEPEGSFGDMVRNHVPKGVGNPEAIRKRWEEHLVSGCLGTQHTLEVIKRFSKVRQGTTDQVSRAPRLCPNGYCPTIRAGTAKDRGGFQSLRPIHPRQNRVITPREAARLQGFPDWYQFDSTKWHSFRQIGNSVSPILAYHILSTILKGGKYDK